MPVEKGFVDAEVLVGHYRLTRNQLNHPVNQKKGVAVGKVGTNFVYIHRHALSGFLLRLSMAASRFWMDSNCEKRTALRFQSRVFDIGVPEE